MDLIHSAMHFEQVAKDWAEDSGMAVGATLGRQNWRIADSDLTGLCARACH